MNHTEPFIFFSERRLVGLTGLHARDLGQLREHLDKVPGSSIFFHTHHMYLAHHFASPVISNDFALWISEALQEPALGEKLAAIDLLSFTSIRELREAIIAIIEAHIRENDGMLRPCPPGDEFHFCRSKSFILRTGLVAHDPREFFDVLPEVSVDSLYYHFFEARLRLGRASNDFSQWLSWRGEEAVRKSLDSLDAYSMNLDEFKKRIIALREALR